MITARDYSVLDKFNFEYKPIGFKFFFTKPEGIKKLEKNFYMCEMIKEAQAGNTFYIGPKDDFKCVEPWILGMVDLEPMIMSGTWGHSQKLYKEPRACLKSYIGVPQMPKGSVSYVAFSPIEKMPFDPDVLVLTAPVPSAQTLLRSVGYSTGNVATTSTVTPCWACAYMYVAPFLSGEMNFTVTGLDLTMPLLRVLPPGLILVSVPWNLIPTMLENLREMDVLHAPDHDLGDGHKLFVKEEKEALRQKIRKINST
jgi:uncharacterized protein (DUF169 family)